jgi:hypothetical protein
MARDGGRTGERAAWGRGWRRLAIGLTTLIALAALVPPQGATRAKSTGAVPIDLSSGTLTQSNCKTTIGCTHPNVSIKSDRFASEATSAQDVSNLLTLRVDGPWQKPKTQTRVELAMNYRLLNPSGKAGNMICATAKTSAGFVHDCVRGLARTGRLALPLASRSADTLWIQFVAMPLAGGNTFEVTGAGLVDSPRDVATPDGTNAPIAIDLQVGALRQVGCRVPVACRHPDVRLDAGVFSSKIPGTQNGDQVVVSDNVDTAQVATGRLMLEFPVPALKKGRPGVLSFDHSLIGASGAPGAIKVWSLAGSKVISSVIDKLGTGRRSVAVGSATGPVESVFVGFEPFASSGGGTFEVSNVTFGAAPSGESLPTTEAVECTDCDPPATRLDPCGEFLDTYYVEAADGREGRGYRCMSPDGHGFFGEGWWNDFDEGRYGHLGYFANEPSDPDAVAIDFGVRRTGLTGEVEYGSPGPVGLNRATIDATRFRVFSSTSSWNEIWTLVPKGELMPRFVGRMPWDGRCGSNGLIGMNPYSRNHHNQRRCVLPTDLGSLGPSPDSASIPFVWYGSAYLDQVDDWDPSGLTTPHIGWLQTPTASARVFSYGAADRCVQVHPSGCRSYEGILIEPVDSEYTGEYVGEDGLLDVFGPGSWAVVHGSELISDLWQLDADSELPPGAALPAPTGICVDSESPCP